MKHHPTTPLMKAVKLGLFGQVEALLVANASVDDTDKRGDTPLHLCVKLEQGSIPAIYTTKMATMLLKAGANPYVRNLEGQSVLDCCDTHTLQHFIMNGYEQQTAEAQPSFKNSASKVIKAHLLSHSSSEIHVPNPRKEDKVIFLSQ